MNDSIDQYKYSNSVSNQTLPIEDPLRKPFLKREILPLNDTQTGTYSSQVIFDLSQISNSGKWAGMRESWIELPIVMSASAVDSADTALALNWTGDNLKNTDFLLSLKNSNLSLINSIIVDYSGTSIVQQTQNINQYLIYKIHESWGEDQERLNGPTLNYGKDSNGWSYQKPTAVVNGSSVGTSLGVGLCNNGNTMQPLFTSSELIDSTNPGMVKRQQNMVKLASGGNNSVDNGRSELWNTNANLKNMNVNYIENTATGKHYYITAILPLKYLHDFFDKIPLLKSSVIRLTLNVNTCYFEVMKDENGKLQFNSNKNVAPNGQIPMMFGASVLTSKYNAPANATDTTSNDVSYYGCGSNNIPCGGVGKQTIVQCSLSISKNNWSQHVAGNNVSHQMTNARIMVPLYTFNTGVESLYLKMGKKEVVYRDVVFQLIENISGNFSFTWSSLYRPKRLIICPLLSKTANGSEFGTPFSPLMSPFTCEPSTCSPYHIQNFQVSIAGNNLYPNFFQYTYDQYLSEIGSSIGFNGNQDKMLCTGKISMLDFVHNYGYIVCDLSKKYIEDESVNVSVSFSGMNLGKKAIDLYCFVEVEKSVVFNLENGAILSRQ